MKINITKLANAVKYQDKKLSMNDTYNMRFYRTDFAHYSLVRAVRLQFRKAISVSEVYEWIEQKVA